MIMEKLNNPVSHISVLFRLRVKEEEKMKEEQEENMKEEQEVQKEEEIMKERNSFCCNACVCPVSPPLLPLQWSEIGSSTDSAFDWKGQMLRTS